MHTTLYIDHDEEITSVVDRLRRSTTADIVFVIPPRAILLQSSVNLRLLRREADKLSKQIMIVTQDELGMRFSQKANIFCQASMEGISEEEEVKEQFVPQITSSRDQIKPPSPMIDGFQISNEYSVNSQPPQYSPRANQQFGARYVPSAQNFQRPVQEISPKIQQSTAQAFHIPINNLRRPSSDAMRQSVVSSQRQPQAQPVIPPRIGRPKIELKNAWPQPIGTPEPPQAIAQSQEVPLRPKPQRTMLPPEETYDFAALGSDQFRASAGREERINQLFSSPNNVPIPRTASSPTRLAKKIKEKPIKTQEVTVSRKLRRTFLILGITCFLVASAAAAYIFIPHTRITIWPRIEEQTVNLEINGDGAINAPVSDIRTIPIRVIEQQKDDRVTLPATGSAASGDQKARGTVVISNEYSEEAQTLVATTRILSLDNKLFRLAESVTIPGYTKESGIIKGGTAEAKVVADGQGTEYNIAPTTFTIPGFQGTSKAAKFKVTSSHPMTGGGLKGNGIPVISEDDIAIAKKQVEDKVQSQVTIQLQNSLPAGTVLLNDVAKAEVVSFTVTPDVGMAATSFDYAATVKISLIAYSEADVRKFVIEMMNKNGVKAQDQSAIDITFSNSNISADFASKKALWRTQAKIMAKSSVDLEQFKREVLGKNQDEIRTILDHYPAINRIDVEFLPVNIPISSRVSRFSQRVEIIVENSEE